MVRAYPNLAAEKLVESRRSAREEPRIFARGCSLAKMIWVFVITSLLGDLIETVFCYFTAGVIMSRSSLIYGPFSIVWGLGGVLMTLFLHRAVDRSDSYLFLLGTLLGGVYEYMCSVFTELAFGTVFWDYSHLPFNLGGRINLLYCFFWGIAGVVWIRCVYPPMSPAHRAHPPPRRAGGHLRAGGVHGGQHGRLRPGPGAVRPAPRPAPGGADRGVGVSGPALPRRAHGAGLSHIIFVD